MSTRVLMKIVSFERIRLEGLLTPGVDTAEIVLCQDLLKRVRVSFMQSDGGLADSSQFYGFRAILSGPAGGVVGYSHTTPTLTGTCASLRVHARCVVIRSSCYFTDVRL